MSKEQKQIKRDAEQEATDAGAGKMCLCNKMYSESSHD